jgi:hypothetical protein
MDEFGTGTVANEMHMFIRIKLNSVCKYNTLILGILVSSIRVYCSRIFMPIPYNNLPCFRNPALYYRLDSCVLVEATSSRHDWLLLCEQIAKDILSPLPELEALMRI